MAASFQISGPGPIRGVRVQTDGHEQGLGMDMMGSTAAVAGDPEFRERLESEAFERGRAQGRIEALAAAESSAAAIAQRTISESEARLNTLVAELSAGMAAARRRQEELMVELISESVTKLVGTLPHRAELAASVARQCLETLGSAQPVSLVLHPEDHAELLAAAPPGSADPLGAAGVPIRTSPLVGRGGCRVETDFGTLDGSLAGRLEALREVMCA